MLTSAEYQSNPKTDLETIVEILYSLFSQRRRQESRKYEGRNYTPQSGSTEPQLSNPHSTAQSMAPSASAQSTRAPSASSQSTRSQLTLAAQLSDEPHYHEVLSRLDELTQTSSEPDPDPVAVQSQAEKIPPRAAVSYARPSSGRAKIEYLNDILANQIFGGAQPHAQPLGGYRSRQSEQRESALALELRQAIESIYTRQTDSSQAIQPRRRQDKLDVVPQGRKISEGLYSLDLKIEESAIQPHYSEKTLMRVKTSDGVETIELDSSSTIAKAYRALDDKGLVGLFEKTDSGDIQLKEVLGLGSSKLEIKESARGDISISYHQPQQSASDFEYLNRELVLNPMSRNHGYDFMRPVVVSAERASDSKIRALSVIDEQGREGLYEVRNNSAIAIMADAMLENGYTPEIRKMDVLSNDGSRIESGIYIKNAYKTGTFGQKQALITDTNHGGLWVELSKGNSRSEFVDGMGCSLNLERATPKPGQLIEARLGVVGRYDNRQI